MKFKSLAISVLSFVIVLILACDVDPYNKISVNDNRANVISILGEPVSPEKGVSDSVKANISSMLQKLDNNDSKYFSIWDRGDNLYYVIGFDNNDKVKKKHRFLMLDQ